MAGKDDSKDRSGSRLGRFLLIMIIGGVLLYTFKTGREAKAYNPEALKEAGCPESLLELAERNPETEKFVVNYLSYQESIEDIDISRDIKKSDGIPLFLQWDERWGYENYGSDFMAITGCGPTCISMVYSGLTERADMTPIDVAHMAENEGFYVEGCGSSWDMMATIPVELGLTVNQVIFDADHIKSELEAGHPIISVLGPGDFTQSGHFIVLTGVDSDGKIKVNDPNSKINSSKSWDINNLMSQIKNLWSYSSASES